MKITPIKIFAFIILMLLMACSAQKNTGLSRAYHNLTARYNVLFNGTESYNDGLEKIEKDFRDDYSEILPIFKYESKEAVSVAGSDMDRAIKKCSKLITLHSITAKPKARDNKTLSPEEREFFNKKEYNVFVDDAYLLMGKAHFYKHEFSLASEVFNKIINDFKNQPSSIEAQLWIARISVITGKYVDASGMLSGLTNNASFPEKLLTDLYTTYADYYLKQKDFPKSISYLEKTLEIEKHKKIRTRYLYILAQLYEKSGELKKASDYYAKVIKMNPVYEMAFNAHINRALAYEQGFGKAAEIENELKKMLSDDKNIDFQDQIYYALGNLAIKEGDEKKAVEYYRKSIEVNKDNNQQKVRSFLTLANHYYSLPDYPLAQAYYDSVITYIEPDYPGYNAIFTKSKSLTRLVTEINTVHLGDSVLYLAQLPNDELNKHIDGLIAKERKQQDEAREKEREKQLDEQFGQEAAMKNAVRQNATNTGAQWYFYNDAAKNLGFREFKVKFGNRKLEDHWQRASKAVVMMAGESEELQAPDGTTENNTETLSPMTREYYLKAIPFTDSAKNATLKNIEAALYNMGMIYKEDLKDYEKSNESFRELIKRFPSSVYLLPAYYNLYGIAREQNNQAMMEYYKSTIARDFPESMYAKVLTDPEYFIKLEKQENQIQDYYNDTYKLYTEGRYSDVLNRTNEARKLYASHKLYPQFTYLGILAGGKLSDRKVFRDSLIAVAARFPNTEIAQDARNLINYMDHEHPEIREAEEVRISQEIYSYSPVSRHLFMFALDKGANTNQFVFNIINYNLDHHDSLNLIVEVIPVDNKNLVTVKTFRNQDQAMKYLNEISVSGEILKDIPETSMIPFIISDRNLEVLRKDKSVDRYLKFYNQKYR